MNATQIEVVISEANAMRKDTLDLLDRLQRTSLPSSAMARLARGPFRWAQIALMRQLGWERPVRVTLPWGAQFHGLLPEGVTNLIWRFGSYEAGTSIFIARHLPAGGCFVDIGSHFGYFTLLSSHLVGHSGRVVSIEAMPETFGMLKANVAANNLSNVTTFNNAASAEPQVLTFRDFGLVLSSLNTSALPRGVVGEPRKNVQVDAQPADLLLDKAGIVKVDMVKIDAESSEEHVIRGLRATLERDHPLTLIELGGMHDDAAENARIADIFQFMRSLGYRAYRAAGEGFAEITETQGLPYLNVIFRVT